MTTQRLPFFLILIPQRPKQLDYVGLEPGFRCVCHVAYVAYITYVAYAVYIECNLDCPETIFWQPLPEVESALAAAKAAGATQNTKQRLYRKVMRANPRHQFHPGTADLRKILFGLIQDSHRSSTK